MKRMILGMAGSLALCVLTACGGGEAEGNAAAGASETAAALTKTWAPKSAITVTSTAPKTGITRFVYFLPQGETLRPEYQQAIATAALTVQSWYAGQLQGRSIRLSAPVVEICRGKQPAAWYSTQSWSRVFSAMNACDAKFRYNDPSTRWVVYAQVRHQCKAPEPLGAGGSGVTIMPVQDLQGLAGDSNIVDDCGKPSPFKGPSGVNRWIGGLAHELGHALGLPHPAACDAGSATCDRDALMWTGYAAYPNTYLRAADKQQLLQNNTFLFDAAKR